MRKLTSDWDGFMALSPRDRMKRALEAGETARAFAKLGVESRGRKCWRNGTPNRDL